MKPLTGILFSLFGLAIASTPVNGMPVSALNVEPNAACRGLWQTTLPIELNRSVSLNETGLDGDPTTYDVQQVYTNPAVNRITVTHTVRYERGAYDLAVRMAELNEVGYLASLDECSNAIAGDSKLRTFRRNGLNYSFAYVALNNPHRLTRSEVVIIQLNEDR